LRFLRKKSKSQTSPPSRNRNDYRYTAEDGSVWDSKYEHAVYTNLLAQNILVDRGRRGPIDTFPYFQYTKSGLCRDCGSTKVGKQRSYTPDLFRHTVRPESENSRDQGYWIEVKGYIRAPERSLLRSFVKERPDVDLRFIFQRDFYVTKPTAKRPDGLRITTWALRFLQARSIVWDGKGKLTLPEGW